MESLTGPSFLFSVTLCLRGDLAFVTTLLGLNRKDHNLWRDAKADWKNACTDARGDEHVMAVLEDLASRVALTEMRRNNRPAD